MDKLGLGYDDVAAAQPRRRLRVALRASARGPVPRPQRLRHRHPGVRRLRGQPGRPRRRRAGVPAPDRRRQGDRALRRAGDHAPRCSPGQRGMGGQHLELSMIDAVVSFLWADSAANEVLLESDGSQHSSFVAGFRPMRFIDGWGIVTPTSDHDFAGMCRALDVEGYDDPRSRRSASGSSTASVIGADHGHVLRACRQHDAWRRRPSGFEAERVPFAMILTARGADPTTRTRWRSGSSRCTTITSSGGPGCPATPRASARRPASLERRLPGARRAHRRDPHRARPGRPDRRAAGSAASSPDPAHPGPDTIGSRHCDRSRAP